MAIKINSFGGSVVWEIRKHFSNVTSKVMLSYIELLRKGWTQKYIGYFNSRSEVPLFQFVMIETINRCNGICDFCPANAKVESRPFEKMSDDIISKVIDELEKIHFCGTFFPQVNNEPLLDQRLYNILTMVRNNVKGCRICVITNGTLLTIEKLITFLPLIDELVINDYGEKYKLSKNIQEIYNYVKMHKKRFECTNITINRRYTHEILATRAGNSPNKREKNNKVSAACIYPFSDIVIFPNGSVGLCCNDCKEMTSFGNVKDNSLLDIWGSMEYRKLRLDMEQGRLNVPFCQKCDVMDAGSRENAIKNKKLLY